MHQDPQSLLRCHMLAFSAIGGVPIEILYDRMKKVVIGEDADGHVVYNRSLIALGRHYGFSPRASRPYRAKTKGKVERPFSYIRQDFLLARSFRNLEDLNAQLADWLATVANVRLHDTTGRIVAEGFAAEQAELQALPAVPFDELLKLEPASAMMAWCRSTATTTASQTGLGASSRSTNCRTRFAFSIRTARCHASRLGGQPAVPDWSRPGTGRWRGRNAKPQSMT
jgi:hypothetical protein